MSINLNDIAKELAAEEELKEEINIAQIKELMKLIFRYDLEVIVEIWQKYNR